jgi:hypothetical protein
MLKFTEFPTGLVGNSDLAVSSIYCAYMLGCDSTIPLGHTVYASQYSYHAAPEQKEDFNEIKDLALSAAGYATSDAA